MYNTALYESAAVIVVSVCKQLDTGVHYCQVYKYISSLILSTCTEQKALSRQLISGH